MVIHEQPQDVRGSGSWELNTTRYVPMSGGSRSRLPIGTNGIRRYHGFVGIDEALTESIGTMAALYNRLGGGLPDYPEGSFLALLLAQSKKWIAPAAADADG